MKKGLNGKKWKYKKQEMRKEGRKRKGWESTEENRRIMAGGRC